MRANLAIRIHRRRRATMVPLVRSAFGYLVYFGTAVLILSVLGFNPMPFLAGALLRLSRKTGGF